MIKAIHLLHRILPALIFILSPALTFSQTLLEANGPGNTYELINSVLAPGATAVETPDQFDPSFGRHIAEVWDAELGKYVFEFYVHVSVANELQDESTGDTDRQRCEIKTYASSPDNLKGVSGETIVYKWRFRLPVGFQPSSNFTHIHQIKAVGGDDSMPLITITVRKASPNRIELIHNNITKLTTADLSLFTGQWMEATERIKVDSIHGTYSITIKNVSTGATVLSCTNNDLMTIRATNDFIRPKWGIYRNIVNIADLRDEAVRFNSFSIYEEPFTYLESQHVNSEPEFKAVSTSSGINIEYNLPRKETVQLSIFNINGQLIKTLIQHQDQESGSHQNKYDVSTLKNGIYFLRLQTDATQRTIKLIL
ncbi:MAG: T9SS type A sorting domain-containing protein [Paludibacter sp.]|nr:T9SS type A sorting domain-containing protein [Paludibacter sp.]